MAYPAQPVILRPYASTDAEATLAVFTEAILQTAAADYSREQLAVWARPGQRDLREWDASMQARGSVVAEVDGRVVGFSDVSADGYIDMLFVAPGFTRRGIASTLLAFLERRACAGEATSLSADVSITARPFFEHVGFGVVREQHPVRGGVELTNYRMCKAIAPR
ncbi:GNAT family N-acetyltransferase [Curtobacterium ammoniigenes]|uniref:GNAT family N-acetyltransferase n=1 Tax=Curtobacterium ammoniigenes TaxID=395387 RepID=UPI001FE14186|nr:GNAT family N-acetyltransferase [Curtobacterium ammoniigenes]